MPTVPDGFLDGVRATLPLLLGLIPFGLVAGVAAVDAGLSPAQAVGLSAVVFAGASQLATVDLLAQDASLAVVVLTAVVINLRMSMYSASIAPYFEALRRRWSAAYAFLLTDMSYALAIAEFTDGDGDADSTTAPNGGSTGEDGAVRDRWYYFGAAAFMWLVWQLATVVGVVLGASIPESWGVSFAVPLVFLSLLVPELSDRPRIVAALVGGSVAVAGAGWPLNLGLLGGALAGVVAGVVVEGRAAA
ncbi:branched-chain amino acid ABC transporter permease [Haloplanus rallus]|jgi:predicted branched-subunit amino acid permease|uniref:Branched-chain amino acid ABC transporter permease n=1 Tax=Haloplanus rallus TaxID=1816183 RepID=A0A6B9F709_9EURY|nr:MULTISPECIES: AzlC family ABC transporter permease [Haloplanus]QGX95232.1 branched-chain amino acid ABC transporter permease [Haloplanus rallus]